jgi:Ran GTPase-activating protein (RanGAP) involved in mRNA processing and transport
LIAADVQDNRAIASVNLLSNEIGEEQARALVKIKQAKPLLRTLCGLTMEETELDMSGRGLRPSDAILLASDVQDSEALVKLDISGNRLCGVFRGGGTYDASGLAALSKSISNLKELNISDNFLKDEGAKILAPAIEDSRAMAKLTFCGNGGQDGGDGDSVTIESTMTEADFGSKKLDTGGAMLVAAFLPKCP